MQTLRCLALLLIVSGCTGAAAIPTPTPVPTATPTTTPTETPAPLTRSFFIVDEASTVKYEGLLQIGNVKVNGQFKTKGNMVRAVPQGDSYLLDVDVLLVGDPQDSNKDDFVGKALASALEVDKYPNGRFTAKIADPISLAVETTLKTTATGTLELHGQQRPLSFPVDVTFTAGKLTFSGSVKIDLLDFKINIPTALMKSQVTITAAIVAGETR